MGVSVERSKPRWNRGRQMSVKAEKTMRTLTKTALAAALALLLAPIGSVRAAQTDPAPSATAGSAASGIGSVYERMQKVNAGLKSYTAALKLDITSHSFPFLSPKLTGKAFYKKPDKNAIHFDQVPALADKFQSVYPQIEPPAEWNAIYLVMPGTDDGTNANFKLVRRKNGRIDHIDVTVDDKTATIATMTWFYKEEAGGGSISLNQQYMPIGSNYVVKSATGHVDIPKFNADIVSAFSDYKINVAIADRVFKP